MCTYDSPTDSSSLLSTRPMLGRKRPPPPNLPWDVILFPTFSSPNPRILRPPMGSDSPLLLPSPLSSPPRKKRPRKVAPKPGAELKCPYTTDRFVHEVRNAFSSSFSRYSHLAQHLRRTHQRPNRTCRGCCEDPGAVTWKINKFAAHPPYPNNCHLCSPKERNPKWAVRREEFVRRCLIHFFRKSIQHGSSEQWHNMKPPIHVPEHVEEPIVTNLRWLYRIAMAFQMIPYMKSLLGLADEFPGGIRHLCTTMPWTIWPALVVLWGVCWMFVVPELDCLNFIDCDGITAGIEIDLDFARELVDNNPTFNLHQDTHGFALPRTGTLQPEERDRVQHSHIDPRLAFGISPDRLALPSLTSFCPETAALLPDTGRGLDQGSQSQIPGTQHQSSSQGEDSSSTRSSAERERKQPPTCSHCGKVFGEKRSLKRHLREVCNKELHNEKLTCPNKPCKSSQPGSGFTRQEHLTRHLRTCKHKNPNAGPAQGGSALVPIPREAPATHAGKRKRDDAGDAGDEAANRSLIRKMKQNLASARNEAGKEERELHLEGLALEKKEREVHLERLALEKKEREVHLERLAFEKKKRELQEKNDRKNDRFEKREELIRRLDEQYR